MKIATKAETHEEDNIDYVIDSKAGTAKGSSTPDLVNDTTGQEVQEADPSDLAFTADEQAAIIKGTDGVVAGILAARVTTAQSTPPAAAATDGTTPPAQA